MVLQSPWFGRGEVEKLLAIVDIGDLLEFSRKGYFHWGIYVGLKKINGNVTEHCIIHRCVPPDATSSGGYFGSKSTLVSKKLGKKELGSIGIDSLEEVLEDDAVRINNELDRKWMPRNCAEIILKAMQLMNSRPQEPYSLLQNNCEHFVNLCRYGQRFSRQIHTGRKEVVSSIAGLTMSGALRAAAPLILNTAAVPQVGMAVLAGAAILSTVMSVVPPIVHAVKTSKRKRN